MHLLNELFVLHVETEEETILWLHVRLQHFKVNKYIVSRSLSSLDRLIPPLPRMPFENKLQVIISNTRIITTAPILLQNTISIVHKFVKQNYSSYSRLEFFLIFFSRSIGISIMKISCFLLGGEE